MSAIYSDGTDTSFAGVVDRLLEYAHRSGDTVGGVARTLLEAFAREMATFYATLDAAHRSGFLDTAEGPALDQVVAILGIARARAGLLTGRVEFSRAVPAQQDIVIPAGRRVTGVLGNDPLPLFETLAEAVIARGQTSAVVEIQEIRDARSPAPPQLNPGVLTIMPRPVLGVESVRNLEPLRQRQADETDEQLRARSRTVLRESQRGTADAIAAAVREQGVASVEVRELDELPPGELLVVVNDPRLDKDNARTEDAQRRAAEARQRISDAVRAAKPAGIRARIEFQATLHLKLDASLELGDLRLDDRGKARVAAELTEAVVQAARSLPPGSTVRRQKLVAPLLTHPSVAGLHTSVLALRDAKGRAPLADGDLYIGPLEAVKLDAADVTLTWFRRPTLAVELGVKKAGSADITRVAVREAVEQYNAHVRSGGKINLLFDDLKQQLGAGIELTSLTAFRDNAAQTELASDPPDKRTIKLKTDEILELKDTEITA